MNFLTGDTFQVANGLLRLGANGIDPSPEQTLAMFANRELWVHMRLENGMHKWVWFGPNIPPWELPLRLVKQNQMITELHPNYE